MGKTTQMRWVVQRLIERVPEHLGNRAEEVLALLSLLRRGEEPEEPLTATTAAALSAVDELLGQAGDEVWNRLIQRCISKPRGRRPGRPTHMTEAEIRAARSYGGRGSARRWVRLDDGRLVEAQRAPAPQSPASST